jgi:hypothetical protein
MSPSYWEEMPASADESEDSRLAESSESRFIASRSAAQLPPG